MKYPEVIVAPLPEKPAPATVAVYSYASAGFRRERSSRPECFDHVAHAFGYRRIDRQSVQASAAGQLAEQKFDAGRFVRRLKRRQAPRAREP